MGSPRFRLWGIPITVHWTLPVALLLVGGAAWRALGLVAAGELVALVSGVLLSVLAHELGHSAAAHRFGLRTLRIVLTPMGGVAHYEAVAIRPRVEALVTGAGPAVNLALGLALGGVAWLTASALIARLAAINLGLGAFNLLPVYPMDGGRLLRALLVHRLGAARATVLAVLVGVGLVIVLVGIGAWTMQPGILAMSLLLLTLQRREWLQLQASQGATERARHRA